MSLYYQLWEFFLYILDTRPLLDVYMWGRDCLHAEGCGGQREGGGTKKEKEGERKREGKYKFFS